MMISVEEALARCLALVAPLQAEEVALREAAGRWLARPVMAALAQPPFDASAMDGYAVAGDPAAGARFAVIGEAGAGHAFAGHVGAGEAVRIFTGAPVPKGAHRVIIQEDVEAEGATITVKPGADIARHIRPRGQDFEIGTPFAPRRLRAQDLGLLAAMNIPRLPVIRRPVVAIIATGDEVVMPGDTPAPDQIINSNAFMLAAMAEEAGAIARILPIARDSEASLRAVFALAEGADLIVTLGGASVGDHDLVGKVATDLGLDRAFWKVAMRPGKPLMAGRLGAAALLGLPGNPVSAFVCAHLFLRPMLAALQGAPGPAPQPVTARLAVDVAANGPRAHYMRASLSPTADGLLIAPFAQQDSALLSILATADALLIRPVNDPARRAGEGVTFLPV